MFRERRHLSVPEPTPAIRAQQGAGLPLAIFLITVMALITVTIAQLQQTTGEMESLDIQSTRAYYAAESGAQLFLTGVVPASEDVDVTCPPPPPGLDSFDFEEEALSGCNAEISCDLDDDTDPVIATVTSTGTCGAGMDRASRQIEVRVR